MFLRIHKCTLLLEKQLFIISGGYTYVLDLPGCLIMGHSTKQKSVSDRYGAISDEEFLRAVDSMTFDHGETEIRDWKGVSVKNGNKMVTRTG